MRKVAQMSSEDEEVIHLPGNHGESDLWRCKRGQTPERLPASQKVRKRAARLEGSQPAKRARGEAVSIVVRRHLTMRACRRA